MSVLKGADSSAPQPQLYAGKEVWGVYVAGATPHVWTHEEVAELGAHGVPRVLPIVVPPQDEEWWLTNAGYATLEALVREAIAWGVPTDAPLCLDVEEAQAAAIGGTDTQRSWAVACRAHGLVPWLYSNQDFLSHDAWCNKWLAKWPQPAPADPALPADMSGWQYASETDIDLDVFAVDRNWMTPTLEVMTGVVSLALFEGKDAAGAAVVNPPTTTTPAAPTGPAAPVSAPAAPASEETAEAAVIATVIGDLEAAVAKLKAL